MFNTESVYFRTEGGLANADRNNGFQNDAGRNAGGSFYTLSANGNTYGAFYEGEKNQRGFSPIDSTIWLEGPVIMDLSRAYATANEFRVKNRLMRIYKLLTINDKSVNEIMEEF